MNVSVNGRNTEVDPGATVAQVVGLLGRDDSRMGVAVAHNGEVVNRSLWHTTSLRDGDRLEILGAMQGG